MEDFDVVFSDGAFTLNEMRFQGACSLEMIFKVGWHLSACLANIACWTARTLELVDNPAFQKLVVFILKLFIIWFQSISEGSGAAPISLFVDDQEMAHTARADKTAVGPYPIGTNTILLPLVSGNKVCLKIQPRPSNLWGDIVNLFRSSSQVIIEGLLIAKAPTNAKTPTISP